MQINRLKVFSMSEGAGQLNVFDSLKISVGLVCRPDHIGLQDDRVYKVGTQHFDRGQLHV